MNTTMIGVNSRIKYFPWADWNEWRQVHGQIRQVIPSFVTPTTKVGPSAAADAYPDNLEQDLAQCLKALKLWLAKNSSIISSA